MKRTEIRRQRRQQEKRNVTRNMTIGQMQELKQRLTETVADELLLKVFGISVMVLHDKFGSLMKKADGGKTREERFLEECLNLYDSYEKGYLTLEDIERTLEEECGARILRRRYDEW